MVRFCFSGNRALRVSKSQRHSIDYGTMDSVWQAITEAKAKVGNDVDTWEKRVPPIGLPGQPKSMEKSETFNGRTKTNQWEGEFPIPATVKLREEPRKEDVNRWAEDFIRKFNDDRTLQKEESVEPDQGDG